LAAANSECKTENIESVLNFFATIVSPKLLAAELKDLSVVIRLYNSERTVPLKKVTNVSTIRDIFSEKASWRQTLPEVHKLLQLYCTIPLSSATAERTFSVMRRMKTWLRSTMSSNKLNSSMFAAIHKERIDTVSSESVANEFISVMTEGEISC